MIAMTQIQKSIISVDPNDIIFDPDTGTYIQLSTGIVLLPEELPESKGVNKLNIVKLTPPTIDEFFNHLLEEFAEGLSRARNEDWAESIKYPNMEVGQTAPFQCDVPLEYYQIGNKVVKLRNVNKEGNLDGTYEVHKYPPLEFDLVDTFRNHYTKNKRTPDCVSIEGRTTPDMQEDSKINYSTVFEAFFTLLRRIRENPTGKWIESIPLLVDFIVDNISLNNGSRDVGIPELLSTFETMKAEKAAEVRRNQLLNADIEKLRKEKKHLRSQIYGIHSKH